MNAETNQEPRIVGECWTCWECNLSVSGPHSCHDHKRPTSIDMDIEAVV